MSEGFTATLPPQLNDPVAAMPGLGNSARRNPNIQNSDTTEFFNSASLLSDMREVFDTANRQNTSIYPVDPRGLAVFEYGDQRRCRADGRSEGTAGRWIRSGCWPTTPTAARS